MSFPQVEKDSQILANPLRLIFDDFRGNMIGHKSLEPPLVMTMPHCSEGKNEGTQHAKEYRADDEKSDTYHIWEGNVHHEGMGADDGNQHSNIPAIGSVLTCASIKEAYDMMNRLLDCKSAHSGGSSQTLLWIRSNWKHQPYKFNTKGLICKLDCFK